jgi:hypothetical protein
MSLARLSELEQDIIQVAEGSALQAEIALMSLESIHRMIVLKDLPGGSIPGRAAAEAMPRPADTNMVFSTNDQYQVFGYDEPLQPALFSQSNAQDMIMAANQIPFLYHQ